MIQRRQTLFLLTAAILTVVCLCLPLGVFTPGTGLGGEEVMYNLWIMRPDGSLDFSVWALFAILLLTCPITIMAIFSYRNRITQSRFCMFNILLCLGWYAVYAVMAFNAGEDGSSFKPTLTAALPAVNMILYFMARKAILADEELVRSADRIR